MPNIKTGVGFFNPTPLVAGGGFEVSFSRFFVAVNINTLHFGRGSLDSIFVPNLSRNNTFYILIAKAVNL
jgi:hypothetical protein